MPDPAATEPHDDADQASANPIARHPWLTLLAVLLVAVAVLVAIWDWNWFKGPIERRVEAKTGRNFDIAGNLDVDLGRILRIRMDDLRFGNAQWAREPTMAQAERLEFALEFWPLLKRQVRIPDLRLLKPRLRLETGPEGAGNWVLRQDQTDGPDPTFRRIFIDDGRLQYLDAPHKTDIDVSVASRPGAAKDGKNRSWADGNTPIDVTGGGRWKGNRFTLKGHAESPLQLRDRDAPYRIDMRASAGSTDAHARGTLLDPIRMRDFDLKLALSGQNMDDLYPLIGVPTPPTPPYRFDGRLTRKIDGKTSTWHYDGFSGKVGDSDLAGSASVKLGGKRPFLRADVRSKRLDFDDLAVFIGRAPQAGRGETTNTELAALAARQAGTAKVLPDEPYNLEKIRAMDADVRLRASRITAPRLPLDDMDAHMFLQGGVVRLEPLNFGVAGGDIRSTIRMDARESVIRTDAKITGRGLDLPTLVPQAESLRGAIGKLGADMQLNGRGNSIARMFASANGDAALGMGGGRISKLLMRKAGIDLAGIARIKLTQDSLIPVRCGLGDFSVRNGVMTSRKFVFDTSDIVLLGSGDISLRDETIQLVIQPRPKRLRLLTLRSPLHAGGTFRHPTLRPDYKRVGLRAAAAVALGTIFPPAAALAATTSMARSTDSDCGRYGK